MLYGVITFNNNLIEDTAISLTVVTSNYGTQSVGFTVPIGTSGYYFETSLGGTSGIPPIVESYCISSINSYNVSCNTYQCDSSACLCGIPTPTPESTPTPTETPGLCTAYDVQPSGSISVEWFSCSGSYFTSTYFSPTVICAETGTLIITGGEGTITPLYYCAQ